MKIRAEINELENRKIVKKINEIKDKPPIISPFLYTHIAPPIKRWEFISLPFVSGLSL